LLENSRGHKVLSEDQSINGNSFSDECSLEESRDGYADFYDFAPVGYITFSRDALINEINLTGAKQLSVERFNLLQRRFTT
jgi:hypothetical protein